MDSRGFKDKKYPILHLYIYHLIRKKASGSTFITYGEIISVFRRRLHTFDSRTYYLIIQELEELKLLKQVKRFHYELVGGDADKILNNYFFLFD